MESKNQPLVYWGFEQLSPTSPCAFIVLPSVEETRQELDVYEKTNHINGEISSPEIFFLAHFHQEEEANKGPE